MYGRLPNLLGFWIQTDPLPDILCGRPSVLKDGRVKDFKLNTQCSSGGRPVKVHAGAGCGRA